MPKRPLSTRQSLSGESGGESGGGADWGDPLQGGPCDPLPCEVARAATFHSRLAPEEAPWRRPGCSASLPFTPFAVRARAAKAWAAENEERAKREQPPLVTIGLHELRHSHVSQMDAAGFSLEEIGDYVGHSSAWMTDRYRHLLAGHEAEAAERFEAYLTRAREM